MRSTQLFQTLFVPLAFAFSLSACGGEENSNNNNNQQQQQQTCSHSWQCENGSCVCTSGPRKDNSCCHPDSCGSDSNNCDSYCNVCS
jgi:hypothetical protein